jgi:CheY-like chemotaxis protein/glycine cleavage system H lipoate-binding protein
MAIFILAVITFIIADILLRYGLKSWKERKIRREREEALRTSLRLDFSREAKTLKRVTVERPKARILCVDDEEVVLDSFRKILVLDGYSVDTVMSGKEALGLIQSHHYDFVFTDLKMPEMSGEEVAKAVKHLRPDIDVIIITGYATVESAVECMKHGAMDYIQKPFTENELLEMTKRFLIRRNERIRKELKPRVHVTHLPSTEGLLASEFAIPGGVFISEGHTWASMDEDGTVKVGLDDFAKKFIGRIDDLEMPNLGMVVKKGQPLFYVKQGYRTIPFNAPVSGRVAKVNTALKNDLKALDVTPYGDNWVCVIDADQLEVEIPKLKIGKAAVEFYHEELEHANKYVHRISGNGRGGSGDGSAQTLKLGELGQLNDREWDAVVAEFFKR